MSMGWKPGEGIGVKMSRRHRKKLKWSLTQETPKELPPSPPKVDQPSGVKVYGVALPPSSFQQTFQKTSRLDDDDDDFDEIDDEIVRFIYIQWTIFYRNLYFSTQMLLYLR